MKEKPGRWKEKPLLVPKKHIFHGVRVEKCPWKIECFLEDLFLGSQWSIILGYIWLSVKFFLRLEVRQITKDNESLTAGVLS